MQVVSFFNTFILHSMIRSPGGILESYSDIYAIRSPPGYVDSASKVSKEAPGWVFRFMYGWFGFWVVR